MKKFTAIILSLLLFGSVFASCRQNGGLSPSSPPQSVSGGSAASESPVAEIPVLSVAALKGPTAMGMVKLIADSEAGETKNSYVFQIGTTDETVPLLGKGEVDIAAVPANLASVIYNNTNGAYRVAAINTLGVLYTVERGDSIKSVEDLRGRTVYAIGKGAVPEFTVNHVLAGNNMDPAKDLTLEYKSEAAEILPLLMQNEDAVAVLQQPFVANALEKVPGLRVALDWSKEWAAASGGESMAVTGVVIVRGEIIEKYPEAVKAFLEEYALSTAFTNENPAEAAVMIESHGIVAADIAEKAIPDCNIVCITGSDMKKSLSGYLKALFDQNPQSVGGALPTDDFYYIS